uniref:tenascin-like isoform X8 n=1 Tax=Styela clava TaxID=7725 RepID=UPI001939F5F4|nr:tenascin-like isoform X8 [Styela clava]
MLYAIKILFILGVCFSVSCLAKPGKGKSKGKGKHCLYNPCPRGKICHINGKCIGKPFPLPHPCANKYCPPKKVCKLGKCVCETGVEIAGKCLLLPRYCPYVPCGKGKKCFNGKCIDSDSCYIHGCNPGKVCKNNVCVCRTGYDYNGRCSRCPVPKIPKRCPTSCPATCKNPKPSYCTKECDLSRKCVCPPGLVQISKSNDKCVRPSSCKRSCGNKICPAGFKCLAGLCARLVVSLCPYSCPTNKHCVGGLCVCLPPYFSYNGRCIKPCWNNHCPLHSSCYNGKCVCHAGYMKHEGRCYAIPTCDRIHCPYGYYCTKGKCIPSCTAVHCPHGHSCKNGKCIPVSCDTISCPHGHICEYGHCKPVSCDTISCPHGHICEYGHCKPVSCDTISCPHGHICEYGHCKPVTCDTISCPHGHICEYGQCKRICPSFKLYTDCATSCPKTCDNPNPSICTTVCRPGVQCVCPDDMYEKGGSTGICVAKTQCKRYCGWKWCPPHSICAGDRCICTGQGPHFGCEY